MLARLTEFGSLLGALVVPFAVGCNSGGGDSTDAHGGDGSTHDAKPDATDTASAMITLTSLGGLSYTAPITVGGQAFNVIVDTGSSTTGIAGGVHKVSRGTDASYTAGTNAVDEHGTATAQYGDGSMSDRRDLPRHRAAVGSGPSVKLKFASITTDSGFFNRGGGYDGIMGFGPDAALESARPRTSPPRSPAASAPRWRSTCVPIPARCGSAATIHR